MPAEHFVDTNVLLYLLSSDAKKAARAERILLHDAVISVQVLNEIANVARRKIGLQWAELLEFLAGVRRLCRIEALTIDAHIGALALAERYRLSIYDALIVASAQKAGCGVLYSEDLQHGMQFGPLQVCNPFR